MTDEELRENLACAKSDQIQEAIEKLKQAVVQVGQALGELCAEIVDTYAVAVNEVWKKLIAELKDYAVKKEAERDENKGRHAIAITTWIARLLPPKKIEELYGQGVDRGSAPVRVCSTPPMRPPGWLKGKSQGGKTGWKNTTRGVANFADK